MTFCTGADPGEVLWVRTHPLFWEAVKKLREKERKEKGNKYKKGDTIETYKTREGIELALPIYYRNKIYNEDQREALWLEKLDKEERYVCGVKVDISEGEEEYYKLLGMMRQKNKRLGYGDDAKNWELKRYENRRRYLKKLERIKKLYGGVG